MSIRDKKFELDQYARDSLTLFIGRVLGYFDSSEEQYNNFFVLRELLTREEREQLTLTYTFLDDCFTYTKINSLQMKEDIPILKKILSYCEKHNMYEGDWDLMNVAETILKY